HKKIFTEVARETRDWASNYVLQNEAKDVQTLKDKGMTIITKADGLKVDEFRANVSKVVNDRFGAAWGKYYEMIAAVK
ncbi:MAG: ABC transporter substrate-binding protein, partial [Sphaerochaeta sp.]|nr:ABC transporter substrate-binding protein [Sphaerochaeta sp.]